MKNPEWNVDEDEQFNVVSKSVKQSIFEKNSLLVDKLQLDFFNSKLEVSDSKLLDETKPS